MASSNELHILSHRNYIPLYDNLQNKGIRNLKIVDFLISLIMMLNITW
jgi:hypothetical protein